MSMQKIAPIFVGVALGIVFTHVSVALGCVLALGYVGFLYARWFWCMRYKAPRVIKARMLEFAAQPQRSPPPEAVPVLATWPALYADAVTARDRRAVADLLADSYTWSYPLNKQTVTKTRRLKALRFSRIMYAESRCGVEEIRADPLVPDVLWVRFSGHARTHAGETLDAYSWDKCVLDPEGRQIVECETIALQAQ